MRLCNMLGGLLAILHLQCPQKLVLQSLSRRLDACEREISFLQFVVAQFLSRICLKVKANLFFLAERLELADIMQFSMFCCHSRRLSTFS